VLRASVGKRAACRPARPFALTSRSQPQSVRGLGYEKIIAAAARSPLPASSWPTTWPRRTRPRRCREKATERGQRDGRGAAFAAFAADDGGFKDKDLYVFCMDMDGVMLSHAVKPELVGKNLLDFNKYGDELFKDMIKVAQDSGEGWVDYNWPYPGTDEVKAKTSYVMTNDGGFFCGVGAYK
jgi:cytochrome c